MSVKISENLEILNIIKDLDPSTKEVSVLEKFSGELAVGPVDSVAQWIVDFSTSCKESGLEFEFELA